MLLIKNITNKQKHVAATLRSVSAVVFSGSVSSRYIYIYRGYSNVWSEYDFYFIEWSEKMYISWVRNFFTSLVRHSWNIHFFTSLDEIKVIFTPNIWSFFLLYTSLSIEEMQILQILQYLSCFPLTINVNKKKSSSWSYIFHCSEEWKYKFYIFTSENINFSKICILFH